MASSGPTEFGRDLQDADYPMEARFLGRTLIRWKKETAASYEAMHVVSPLDIHGTRGDNALGTTECMASDTRISGPRTLKGGTMKPTKSLIWRAVAAFVIAGAVVAVPASIASAAQGSTNQLTVHPNTAGTFSGCSLTTWYIDAYLQNTPTHPIQCYYVFGYHASHVTDFRDWYYHTTVWTHGTRTFQQVGTTDRVDTVLATNIKFGLGTHVQALTGSVWISWGY